MAEKTLSEQLLTVLDDKASKQDVSRIIKTLVDFVKEAKKKLDEASKKHKEELDAKLEEMSELVSQFAEQTNNNRTSDTAAQQAALQEVRQLLDSKADEIKALIPSSYDDTEIRSLIDEVRTIIPTLPEEMSAEGIRNKLEAAYAEYDEEEKLDPRVIRGMSKLLEEIEELKARPVGGSTTMNVAHWPRHEEFSMDGIATTVTLQTAVAAQGNFVFVRYQGQLLTHGTQYTVDGNKITLVDVPENGTIISVTYVG